MAISLGLIRDELRLLDREPIEQGVALRADGDPGYGVEFLCSDFDGDIRVGKDVVIPGRVRSRTTRRYDVAVVIGQVSERHRPRPSRARAGAGQ
jgi:hypothetical protein